ncbi:hypothetical protein EPO17_02815 [Patescibacteria group bacterium]|nr:MAG: hypothetical protein EPO17_02815 [Patescibacteria group bacterium]
MNVKEPLETPEVEDPDSVGHAMFSGIIFWTVVIASFVWLAVENKALVLRVAGTVLTLTMVVGALTLWPKRKHFALEMSATALLAAAVLWQDNQRVWAIVIAFAVCAGDIALLAKFCAERWLDHYDEEDVTRS